MNVKLHRKFSFWPQLANLGLAGWLALGFCSSSALASTSESDSRRDATVIATEMVMPSVVNIATARVVERAGDPSLEVLRRYFGWQVPTEKHEEPYNIGSGVIVDEEGYILTNFHVLEHATRVQVKLWDGRIYDADPLVYTPLKDVALLKIRAKPGEKFKAIKFAKDDDLLLGETVLALGNPYGLGGSVTRGILSSKNRRPASGHEPLNEQDWLQTDADINPGNSGGPLINLRGELIGINARVHREGEGMGVGFAIPIKQIAAALSEFFAPEIKDGLWFGATVAQTGSDPLVISAVRKASPADKAGLCVGERIVEVNGKMPLSVVDFNRLIIANTNHQVTLKIEQSGQRRVVKMQLVPFEELARMVNQKLGLVLLKLTPQNIGGFPVKPGEGLYIEKVTPHSPADDAQLQSGFLLTEIDDRSAGDLISVAEVLSSKKSGDRVRLGVVVPRRINNNYVDYRQAMVTLSVR